MYWSAAFRLILRLRFTKDFRFEGVLQGKIIEAGGYEVLIEIEKVISTDKNSKAAAQ